jgi:hypothetical protein
MKKYRVILALWLLVASLPAGPLCAETSVSHPFRGVTFIQRSETAPRPLKINIIEIDLTAQGIGFLVTPQSGPRETANQTTLEFLTQLGSQIAVNANFFTPWPADGTGYSWVTGLAASDGTVYSAFERNKGYPYQDNLPALNITASNAASIVYQAEGDTTGYAVDPPVALHNAVCGNEQILTRGVNTAGTGSWDSTLNPRTIIGLAPNDKLILFTVDGRQPGISEGLTTREAAELLLNDYGVTDAINLDGGGSTALAMARPTPLVVNVPTGVNNSPGTLRSVGSNLAVYALYAGDADGDGDVDGSDLASFALNSDGISLSDFAPGFGLAIMH